MEWSIKFLNEKVKAEFLSLPDDIRARFYNFEDLLKQVGIEKLGPKRVKHLRGKLWEIRMTGRDGIGRVIYVTASGRRMVVLHAFMKKTQKTPASAIALAEQRAREMDQ